MLTNRFLLSFIIKILIANIACQNFRPRFTRQSIISSKYESSPTGTIITTLSDYTIDDEGDVITYSLDTVGQSQCSIDSSTGLITLSRTLDREVNSRVLFTAYAEDNYQGGGAHRQAPISVYIYVLDENDCPPEFQGTPYIASIQETAALHQSVFTLSATDKDDGSNAELSFEFKSGTQVPEFSLDSTSGLITVAGQLDYETKSRYTLSVVAKDKGSIPLSAETRVIVDVLDVGDRPPVFSPSAVYEANVNENLRINEKVLKITAADGDQGINNAIRYELISGNDENKFFINSSTGEIKVNGQLDRETKSLYQLGIKAFEISDPPSSAIANATIQLNDVNDFVPTFRNSSFVFVIDEDKPIGYIITQQIVASDGDATATNNAFQYSLSGADSSKFAVNSLSGQLTIDSVLDFETQEKYTFKILARETLSVEKLEGSANVTIQLRNVNDNSPVFNQSIYIFKVYENSEIGRVVGVVKAIDADKGVYGEVSYSLSFTTQAASTMFLIDATNGKLSLKSEPDYESGSLHEFQVSATDGGGSSSKTSSAIIKVEVIDVNDNDPVFTNLPTRIVVPENSPAGRIFTVKATDTDYGLNGRVSFKLMNTSVAEFVFDTTTGDLNTTMPFDFESPKNHFILVIMAHDNGKERRNATQALEIAVQDENDFAPVFSASKLNATIAENARVGSLVIWLNVTDLDSGANSQISYRIVSGNSENAFIISSGEVRTQDLLDREGIDSYELVVKASDHGSPSLSSTATIFINVQDYNDHSPYFLQSSYSVKVNESTAVNSFILQLRAQDNDIGDNARLTYSIVSGNGEGKFKLFNESGALTVAKKLDWETKTTYVLSIRAEDHGITKKSRDTFVTIDIIDDNDNFPVFTESKYTFQTFENIPLGRSIGRVTAIDNDGKIPPNMNGIVKYSIKGGNHKGAFRIDPVLGTIYSNGTIDREENSFYNLTVIASDGGSPVNSAEVQVLVSVLDVNDNSPMFLNRSYQIEVYENVPIGSTISQITAIDKDSGLNAKLSYSIVSGNDGRAFGIKSDGRVTIERGLDRESVQNYQLKINVVDAGAPQKSNETDVNIEVLDVNDNAPVFQGTPYSAEIKEELSAGIYIFQVRATDADTGSNAYIKYRLESLADLFQINETNGIITSKSALDREKQTVYKVNVSARDSGNSNLINSEVVTITLLDLNDHVPVIRNLPNRTYVPENAPTGTTVYQISAYDSDYGENARLSYSVVSGDSGHFSVTNNGKVVTISLLDRERRDSYSIVLNVSDHGSPPLQASSTLNVIVTDINDNSPKFMPDPLLNPASYSIRILEGPASFNKTVFLVNATDADDGENGIIEYSIKSGNEKGYFVINHETGEIKVSRMIDREDTGIDHNSVGLGVFLLVVQAKDKAPIGSQFVTTTVTILVNDVNDNRPVFGSSLYVVGVSEGISVLSAVTTLTATDRDISRNSKIQYSIVGGDPNGDFTIINKYVGTISVAKLINAERISLYNLTVMAKDEGDFNGGIALNSTTIVQVHVGDENDNNPVFNQSTYKTSIKENSPPNTFVIRVSATDADKGTNGEVWYQMTSGNINSAFEINNRTGDIVAVKAIDREQFSKYTLVIKAEDRGMPVKRQSSTEVVITIEDVNDNPMRFKLSNYRGHILENSPAGTKVILTTPIEFDDADSEMTPLFLYLFGPDHEKFRVNSSSFEITSSSNSSFDRESTSTFYLNITARDIDGLSSTAGLVIVVDDVNDNMPTFNVTQSVVAVNENSTIGHKLMYIRAYDKDYGSNSVLSYTMRGGDEKFIYNHTTGLIQLAQKVDRETQDRYKLVIVAVDQGKPPLESSTIINVIIGDSIDSAPYFEPTIVSIAVNESLPVNAIIYTVKANDRDLNDVIRYKLTSSHVQEMELNSQNGEIKLVKPLNRENISNFELKFQAIDSNFLSSPIYGLTLRIKVNDANDNAPVFSQPFYLNDVVENTPDGTIVMQVLATDADEGENGQVTYSIKESISNLLRIDPKEGLISKYGLWQITPGGFLNFTVLARDSGNPAKYGSVNCSIRWVAVNALNPQFNKSLYSIFVSENTAPGSEVIRMTAYKKGKVEAVAFSISGGQGKFNIEINSGVIRVSNPLDRESVDQYAITVTATDNQSPPQTGITSVRIAITDVNDNRPAFSSDAYKFSVSEDAVMSTLVGNVVAVDQDAGNNSKLSYSIQSGNDSDFYVHTSSAKYGELVVGNWFAINQFNGSIQTVSPIDREEQSEFQLTVMVLDHGSPSLSSTVSVTISILDVNDNKPLFAKEIFNITMNENLPGDTQVLALIATDGDNGRNGSVFYSIISGNERDSFYIGRTTGVLRLARVLDYETSTNFSLKILAVDDGTPYNQSSIAYVLIQLYDVNDNTPKFQLPSYFFSVTENAPIGYWIGDVSAVDEDKTYNKIFYKIQNFVSNSIFHVSNQNGSMTLKKSLDRETNDKYIFTLVAFNKDQNGNESLKSSVEVTITVLDENDNIPRFHPPFCCNVSVYENIEIGSTIVRLSASDADAGSNKDIAYSLVSGIHTSDFKVDLSTGDFTLQNSLDHERIAYYEVIVTASDHGKPVMSSNATIRINVLDINDNKPTFLPVNLTTISEDAPVDTIVANVTAFDADSGTNGEISYQILAGNEDGSFAVAPNTGTIKIIKALDYERIQSYSLQIIARDNGVPSISSITTLKVNVTNVNDNIPIFTQGSIYVAFKENSPIGSTIMTSFASDADKDPIYYYIFAGNSNLFAIDENSGVLSNLQILDRETASIYTLTIEATNVKKTNGVGRYRRAAALSNGASASSRQNVVIQVTDENDNPPIFTQREYRAGVSETAKYGTSIIQVVANDFDVGDNSNVSYSAIDNSNSDRIFQIDKKTGWILSAKSFIGKVGQNFRLKILAVDNGGKQPHYNDTTIVNVFVLTDNQRVVLTMKLSPQIVRDNIKEIIQSLENITSFKINIDEIQYSSKDGQYDTTSTDLVFHALDQTTNSIQDKDTVILAIERNEAKYKDFFSKWKVQAVKAVVTPTSAPVQDDTYTILIAVAAALFLIIVGFVFAICHIRRKQGRKLKAATASSKDLDATVSREHMQKLRNIVKGSTAGSESSQMQKSVRKASERFYPMWVEPQDDVFDSARPLMKSFHVKCSSASYCEESRSMNSISNTRTMATEILMMSDPYIGETVVDSYMYGEEDIYYSEDMSDMFDSQTDGDIGQSSEIIPSVALQTPSKEELLLRASLQPTATLEVDGINVTSI